MINIFKQYRYSFYNEYNIIFLDLHMTSFLLRNKLNV